MRGVTLAHPQIDNHAAISTHTPHAGRDASGIIVFDAEETFQLTHPMRGVTATF